MPVTPAPDSARSLLSRIDADEWAYLISRTMLAILLAVLYVLDILGPVSLLDRTAYWVALSLLALDTIVLYIAALGARSTTDRAMMFVLVPDMVASAIFTYLSRPDDTYYPAIILFPIFYALVASKRDAWIAGAAATVAYLSGLVFFGPQTIADTTMYAFKAALIPAVAVLVANAVDRQRSREHSAEQSAAHTEHLNEQLKRRVHELQAVTEITEIIHSTLDFDSVGPEVLEIVASAIGVKTCCLFVIDRTDSKTLFSASRGTSATVSDFAGTGGAFANASEHLTCIPVFDHDPAMVLFCTTPESLAHLSEEDRLVLGAVASELVVAVENSRLYKLTSHLAVTDELTGLANYRHLQQRLDEELARAVRYDKQLSLLMLDADGFKLFNDSQGHVAGDVALAELGPIFRSLVREVDLVARYGGEEFSVVLPETDAAGAYVVAEKIREAVEMHQFADADGDRTCSLTVSVGLATYPTHARDKDSLLREADDALYRAKNGGRNRVRTPQRTGSFTPVSPADARPEDDEWMGA